MKILRGIGMLIVAIFYTIAIFMLCLIEISISGSRQLYLYVFNRKKYIKERTEDESINYKYF